MSRVLILSSVALVIGLFIAMFNNISPNTAGSVTNQEITSNISSNESAQRFDTPEYTKNPNASHHQFSNKSESSENIGVKSDSNDVIDGNVEATPLPDESEPAQLTAEELNIELLATSQVNSWEDLYELIQQLLSNRGQPSWHPITEQLISDSPIDEAEFTPWLVDQNDLGLNKLEYAWAIAQVEQLPKSPKTQQLRLTFQYMRAKNNADTMSYSNRFSVFQSVEKTFPDDVEQSHYQSNMYDIKEDLFFDDEIIRVEAYQNAFIKRFE